jgi:hypothetical protein
MATGARGIPNALGWTAARVALCAAWLGACSACAHAPSIRDLSPLEAQHLRAGLARIGVRTAADRATLTFRQPAKGAWGGAQRGAVVGALAPIAIGAVFPLPGTTFLGILVAPVTALGGAIYGSVAALPGAEVQRAEDSIGRAFAALQETRPVLRLRDRIVELGHATTGRLFTALDGLQPDATQGGDVDALLDLSDPRTGLQGAWRIDPPSIAFAEIRVRLRTPAGDTLLEETVFCSGEERSYLEWAADDGALFAAAIDSCVGAIAEKIVDDFFLVYPRPERRLDGVEHG